MENVASDITAVDLLERGIAGRTSSFFVDAPRPGIIETGARNSVEILLEAIDAKGLARDHVAYVIVTHIHLDHAGGAGTLLKELPNAQVVVHPKGARHLVDPSRLWEGARGVFGEGILELWGEPEPVPEERLVIPEDGETLDLGGGHRLRFIDAPGHARHQYMILDEGNGALLSGDELGVRYPQLAREPAEGRPGWDYVLPTTAPNQFDPEAMIRSARSLKDLKPATVLPSHFGRLRLPVDELAERIEQQVRHFMECATEDNHAVDDVQQCLENQIEKDAERYGLDPGQTLKLAGLDLLINSAGIAYYYERRAQKG